LSREIDPEVLADIRLRDATTRDRSRSGEATWSKPVILGQVPCRNRCGRLVDWPDAAQDRFEFFNAVLERRGEAPLDKTRILFCTPCIEAGKLEAGNVRRKEVDIVAGWIRELKDGCDAKRDAELLTKLAKVHPDIDGLKQALNERRKTGKRGKVPV